MLNYENKKYLIHDTVVDNIKATSDGLILFFQKGIYCLNCDNDELNITPPCRMYIFIKSFDMESIYQHIGITKLCRYIYKEISFDSFVRTVQKYSFNVYLDYYSYFANSIMIEGLSNNLTYYFKITEIQNIKFVFDS